MSLSNLQPGSVGSVISAPFVGGERYVSTFQVFPGSTANSNVLFDAVNTSVTTDASNFIIGPDGSGNYTCLQSGMYELNTSVQYDPSGTDTTSSERYLAFQTPVSAPGTGIILGVQIDSVDIDFTPDQLSTQTADTFVKLTAGQQFYVVYAMTNTFVGNGKILGLSTASPSGGYSFLRWRYFGKVE